MTRKLRHLLLVGIGFLLCWSVAQAAQVPITVYPDPIQFGTVPLNSTSIPVLILLSNSSANTVDVTAMTFSGANSSDFAFSGPNCVGFIQGGQVCQMFLTFTPSAIGSLSASLSIAFTGTGSPLTIPLQGSGGNPVPTLTSLSPASAYAGSAGFTLTINGTGFLPTSVAYWGFSIPLTTTYKSSTQIKAQVPASFLTGTGSEFVSVTNPPPGGGSSGDLTFQIVALDPFLQSVSPLSLVAGTAATSITLNGDNFMTGAKVLWNGNPLATTYINSNELQAQLKTTELAKPGIIQLSVSNPSPGGVSSTLNFNVTFPAVVRILNIPANDLVWDPFAQRIYASVPSSFGANGNSIAVINPANGSIGGYHFAGSEPTQLALSADASYLYAGLNGNGSVQRLVLPAFTLDIDVNLGTSQFGGLNMAGDLQVSPGDSHTFAVTLGNGQCCGGGPLEFFTDSTLLPNSISFPQITSMQFADASTLYGYASNTVSQVSVNASGGTLTTQWNGLVTGNTIQFDAGLIYGSGGQVLNPLIGELVGTYDVGGGFTSNDLLPESAINSTFVLGTSPFFNALGITSYNLAHFTPLAVINLSQISEGVTPTFISWGKNGLAFIAATGCCGSEVLQTVLVQSPMMQPVSGTENPSPVAGSLSPASAIHGGGNFKITITGSGFVPGTQATWNGSERTVDYASPTQMIMYVPWSDVASSGKASVIVTNPAPGGGKSSALTFTIN